MLASNDNSRSGEDTQSAGAESVLGCALLLARRVRDPRPRSGTLCKVVERYVELGDNKRATKVLSEALRTAGDVKDSGEKADLLLEISVRCSLAEDLEKALRVARRIGPPESSANALASVAAAYALKGEREIAFEIVEKIKSPDHKAMALSFLAAGYAERGNKREARRVLARVFDTIGKDPEATDTDCALAEIVHHCTTAGLLRDALRAVRRIKDRYWKVWATVRTADVYRKRGKKEKCRSSLYKALGLSQSIRDTYRKVEAWRELSKAFSTCGEHETAALLLDRAFHSAARTRGFTRRYLALSATAIGYASHGDCDQALRVAKRLHYYYSDDGSLSSVAGAFAEAGRFDKGLKTAESIRNTRGRAMALAGVAFGFAKHGHLNQARWVARSIKQSDGRSDAFRRLATMHLEAGQYLEAVRAVKQIPLPHIQAATLAAIAMRYVEEGHAPGPEETRILQDIAKRRL